MKINNKYFGTSGEKLAAEYLQKKGYEIIKFNYRFHHGEIDLIAKEKDVLVFVEVKTRLSEKYGTPINAISRNKINQIRKIADAYLAVNKIKDTDCRIDFIGIFYKNSIPEIEHLENIG
ncbi:MAG: YraN family protein [Ignavibacteriaceae bacterium]|jgi:putative endonuclease|nr:YraN family protein [Ignavibacteriaceae bacterium]